MAVHEAENAEILDPGLRALVACELYRHAFDIVNERSDYMVAWVAIRRMATLSTKRGLVRLEFFLMPRHDITIRQVALQAIANCSARGPLPELRELIPLFETTEAVARELVRPGLIDDPKQAAIAIAAVIALVAERNPRAPQFVEILKTGRSGLMHMFEDELHMMRKGWGYP